MKFLNTDTDFQVGDKVRRKHDYDWHTVIGFYQSFHVKGTDVYDWILLAKQEDNYTCFTQEPPELLTREF